MPKTLLFIFAVLFCCKLSAQDAGIKIPPVTSGDFSPVSTLIDSETEAVILLDSGSSTVDANPQDGFFVNYYIFRRVLIRKKTALEEVGKIGGIYFSEDLNGKKLKNVKAITYNLINGQVFKEVVPDKDIFVDNSKNGIHEEKFAFPNAKDGSIVEYEISAKLDTYNLIDWNFQDEYPVLKSVYSVQVPDGFNYSIQFQNKKYLTGTSMNAYVKTLYAWTNFENTTIHDIVWTYTNIPPIQDDVFTSTIKNFIGCVRFQPSAIPTQPGISKGVWNDWPWYAKLLLQASNFGKAMDDPSTYIRSQAKLFAGEDSSDLEKARGIYSNVRDHFKVTDRARFMRSDQNFTSIYKERIGNVAEINMILIAMLRSQKIHADPVILATKDEGLTNQQYPILDNYNYLICRSVIDGKEYFLDASSPYMAFGKLPSECYNGHARVITKETFPVFLAPDSVRESIHIVANISNTNDSKYMNLEWTKQAGLYESCDYHSELKEKNEEFIFKSETDKVPFKKSLDSFSITDLKNMDQPLTLYYKMSLDPGNGPRIYINPLLSYGLTENPFKSAQRNYPVEMPFVFDKTYELNMEIPAGYEIDELPKSEKFILNESEGSYEYRVEAAGNMIHVKSIMILDKAIFDPEEYSDLRQFYTTLIKKQNEMIVFKKK